MEINNLISFKIKSGLGKTGREYHAVYICIDNEVEKLLCFLSDSEYKLITK